MCNLGGCGGGSMVGLHDGVGEQSDFAECVNYESGVGKLIDTLGPFHWIRIFYMQARWEALMWPALDERKKAKQN